MTTSKIQKLTAADIMKKHVLAVGPQDALQEAMSLMTENHVTGLPVLDGKDRCVGVVSSTDILNFAEASIEQDDVESGRFYNPDTARWETIGLSAFMADHYGDTPVAEIMSRDPISVQPTDPVDEVARTMCEHRVHRVLVLDDQNMLHGIISAFDFVELAAC